LRNSHCGGQGRRGTKPQPRSNAGQLEYGAQTLRFSKGPKIYVSHKLQHVALCPGAFRQFPALQARTRLEAEKTPRHLTDMDHQVSNFAGKLRANAAALGLMDGVEWRLSEEPVAYQDAVSEMEKRVAAITSGEAPELIWLLEHPPLYTAGTSAKEADLLDGARFPVYPAGRGGQYTYHGPGQLVAYVMLNLDLRGRDVRCHVHRLEEWMIATLRGYGVQGERREGRPGIWVRMAGSGDEGLAASASKDAKIAAVGVRVRRWITYHGVAVNVCPDLSHFAGIVPCGISDAGVTSLSALKPGVSPIPYSLPLPVNEEARNG
jgi:lipoyl(octanoyl) transferase